MTAIDHDLEAVERRPVDIQKDVDARANAIVNTMFNVVSDVDIDAAAARVEQLRRQFPNLSPAELAQKLISLKCQKTGTVGAVTAGAGLVPGIGTAAAITLGTAADIGVTFKMQAELVLEIAAVYDYPLSEEEKKRLVMAITGISAGTSLLTRRAGQNIALKASEHVASKTILKAIPVVGMIASAGTNVLSTYIIGQRADAYFRLGPEAVGSWSDSLRAISGLDERKIGAWLAESSKTTGAALAVGASKMGEAGKAAGGAVWVGAGKVAGSVSSGAKIAGDTAQRGGRAYLRWAVSAWAAAFRLAGGLLKFGWAVLTFVPRKVIGLFRRKEANQ